MSITLMAYPTAFLISPEKAKNEKVKIFNISEETDETAKKSLRDIRVLVNIDYAELRYLMSRINDCHEIAPQVFLFSNGMKAKWQIDGKSCSVILSGCNNAQDLQENGEKYFQELDKIAGRNVRVIQSREYFYYTYETEYKSIQAIYEALVNQKAHNILLNKNTASVTAEVEGDNIRYYLEGEKYLLEVEKHINILNIGFNGELEGYKSQSNAYQSIKIQTNIKPEELVDLLQKAGYYLSRGNGQTPIKTLNATLNWYLHDGVYIAEFYGPNSKSLTNEIEQIFKKMNVAAGRDLRFINQKSTVIYTYNTNYTDKTVLINTLLEHGASNLIENDEQVSCRLFDMEMVYSKKDGCGAYVLEITRVSDMGDCQNLMDNLNEEYGLNIQEITYNKIKERLSEQNMRLEDETVLEDNSIVLTIDIG